MSSLDENMIHTEINSRIVSMRNEISRLKAFCLYLMPDSGVVTIPSRELSSVNPSAFNWEYRNDDKWLLEDLSKVVEEKE